ncbi:MAG: proteasome assembly chaperone family protein [archaeon]
MEILIKITAKPKFKKSPILIEGLPGFGQVGRVAVEHLISELKAKKFAELISPSFPPEVFVDNTGMVRRVNNEFYYYSGKKNDLILLIGETQASDVRGQYELVEAIVKLSKRYKVKEMITLGGYATGALKEKPQVYGASTSKKFIEKYEKHGIVFKSKTERGGIVGASGLLLGIGQLYGIEGVCLMGETPGHPLFVDAKSAEAVLKKLMKILDMKLDLKKLDKRVKEIEKFRTTIQQLMQKAMEKPEEKPDLEKVRYIG